MFKTFIIFISIILLFPGHQRDAIAQGPKQSKLSQHNETILNLMEDIFAKIPKDLVEIDPGLNRIAVYRIDVDDALLTPPLRTHFESRLVEVFGILGQPAMVSLPEMNTLRITGTDSSFSVMNSLPTPDEIWRVGRRLRVDAFLEGNLTFVKDKALFLDLRLNRTGTNEILWVKSYAAYVKGMKVKPTNPLRKSVNAGLEVFTIHVNTGLDTLLHPDFANRLVQYSVYFGIYQFMTATSRLRYELRGGMSFLSEGVRLSNTSFPNATFYSRKGGNGSMTKPISFNFKMLLYATIFPSRKNNSGDWLAIYASLTRYFTTSMPDLTGLGVGFRADLSPNFSLSAGFSMMIGPEFDSQPLSLTGQTFRTRVDGLHYEVMMLQYSF